MIDIRIAELVATQNNFAVRDLTCLMQQKLSIHLYVFINDQYLRFVLMIIKINLQLK